MKELILHKNLQHFQEGQTVHSSVKMQSSYPLAQFADGLSERKYVK